MKLIFTILAICSFMVSLPSQAAAFRIVSEHLPPHQISQNGKLVGGTAYFVMQELLKRTQNTDVRMDVLPWARAYKTALEQRNVIIFSIARSKEREAKFQWIGELNEINFNFYALNDRNTSQFSMVKDAWFYNVVAVRDSISSERLQQLGFVEGENLIHTKGISEALDILRRGRADFVYTSDNIAKTLFKEAGLSVNALIKQTNSEEKHTNDSARQTVYVAASLGTDPQLVAQFTQVLQEIKDDGTYAQILSQQQARQSLIGDTIAMASR